MTSIPSPVGPLVARTARRHDVRGAPDLLAHLGPGGFAWLAPSGPSFVTDGAVAEVDPARALDTVAALAHDGLRPSRAAGAIVVGALPFAGPGRLVVPARVVGFDPDGGGWTTEVTRRPDPARSDDGPVTGAPARFTVEAITDRQAWRAAVDELLGLIAAGELTKAVLARAVRVVADAAFDVPAVAERLRRQQPGCTVYADRGFVGATPELLVRRLGTEVESRPLAGTVGRGADAAEDDRVVAELLRSAKERREHRVVVDAVRAALAPVCTDVSASEPEAERFVGVVHLASRVRGHLADPAADVLTLVRRLHPTPAVGGEPTGTALRALGRHEPVPRGRYAGPVGWMAASGDGEWCVALRGAEVDGPTAVLHAGAGIVAGSDADAEWEETAVKLEPMLRALVHP